MSLLSRRPIRTSRPELILTLFFFIILAVGALGYLIGAGL